MTTIKSKPTVGFDGLPVIRLTNSLVGATERPVTTMQRLLMEWSPASIAFFDEITEAAPPGDQSVPGDQP